MNTLDRLILGDNPFFGVSHMSEERGMAQAVRFQETPAIISVLDAAYDAGIRGFSFSTHDRVRQLCDHFRAHPDRYRDLRLYPALPYAQKYAMAVNEKGVLGAVKDVILGDNTAGGVLGMLARGSTAVLTQNPVEMMKLLVDAEMRMFRGLKLGAVFLQNNIADLLMGLAFKEVFTEFVAYVEKKFGAPAGFMTLNLPRMTDFLIDVCGLRSPLICSAINPVGFQMSPDRAAYEKTLAQRDVRAVAMSVMAAGAVTPERAFEYLAKLPRVEAVVFGASSERNIRRTMEIASRCWKE